MKRIFLLLTAITFFGLNSCTVNEGAPGRDGYDGQDGQGSIISEVFELKNINFGFTDNEYKIRQTLNPKIFASDVLLIYRLSGTLDSTTPIWQPLPRTLYLGDGKELDYDFDFSKEDFTIYAGGNYPLNTTPNYINDETFRIVIVPGAFSNKGAVSKTLSYEEAIVKYNIDDSKVISLN